MITHCLQCQQLFTATNVHTDAGWRETQISGFCEDCFDALFAEVEAGFDEEDLHDEL